jgi:hypothetical protein
MTAQRPGLAKPALISGSIFGVVAGLPLIGALNCICCSYIIGAGLLAAYLYSKESKAAGTIFGPGEGALIGVLAGLVYAPITWLIGSVVMLVGGGGLDEILTGLQQAGVDVPEGIEDTLSGGGGRGIVMLISLVVNLVLGAIFATLGGVIGGLLFRVTPRAETIEPPGPGSYGPPPQGPATPPGDASPPPSPGGGL